MFSSLRTPRRKAGRLPDRRHNRPALEVLESRQLLVSGPMAIPAATILAIDFTSSLNLLRADNSDTGYAPTGHSLDPAVEYRLWPIADRPGRRFRRSLVKTSATSPMAFSVRN